LKFGVISDTHDQAERTAAAVERLRRSGARVLFHCGDFTDAGLMGLFKGIRTYAVRGNNDWDEAGLRGAAKAAGVVWLGAGGMAEEGGCRVALTHGHLPKMREQLLLTKPDFLFLGHSHRRHETIESGVKVVNPGALYRVVPKTCALVDSRTGVVSFLEIA